MVPKGCSIVSEAGRFDVKRAVIVFANMYYNHPLMPYMVLLELSYRERSSTSYRANRYTPTTETSCLKNLLVRGSQHSGKNCIAEIQETGDRIAVYRYEIIE